MTCHSCDDRIYFDSFIHIGYDINSILAVIYFNNIYDKKKLKYNGCLCVKLA